MVKKKSSANETSEQEGNSMSDVFEEVEQSSPFVAAEVVTSDLEQNNGESFPANSLSAREELPLVPTWTDPTWEQYVLSLFNKENGEVDDKGRPKVHGLRRIVRELVGPIVYSGPRVVQFPTPDNHGRSTVEWYVKVLNKRQLESDEAPYILESGEAADAWSGNIRNDNYNNNGPNFSDFPVANAATRAEGRALRKLLNLRTIAAEEVSGIDSGGDGAPQKLSKSQLSRIDIMCQRNDIDVTKLLDGVITKNGYSEILDISFEDGQGILKALSVYQNGSNSEVVTKMDKLKGYQENWRDEK